MASDGHTQPGADTESPGYNPSWGDDPASLLDHQYAAVVAGQIDPLRNGMATFDPAPPAPEEDPWYEPSVQETHSTLFVLAPDEEMVSLWRDEVLVDPTRCLELFTETRERLKLLQRVASGFDPENSALNNSQGWTNLKNSLFAPDLTNARNPTDLQTIPESAAEYAYGWILQMIDGPVATEDLSEADKQPCNNVKTMIEKFRLRTGTDRERMSDLHLHLLSLQEACTQFEDENDDSW